MKTPLVTLARPAWRTLVKATTDEPDKETFGYLVGRYTRVGARVHHVYMVKDENLTNDNEHLWYADSDAAKIEAALLKKYAPLEVIGKCHSQVYFPPRTSSRVITGALDSTAERTSFLEVTASRFRDLESALRNCCHPVAVKYCRFV